MATVLTVQEWGADSRSISFSNADASGNSIPGNDGNMMLIVTNSGAAPLRVRLKSATACSAARNTHDLDVSIANGGARHYIPTGYGRARKRFGPSVTIEYPDGTDGTNLKVAAVRFDEHQGRGTDEETPVALGASPGTVTVTDKDTEPVFTVANADGMLCANDGYTQIWIDNGGPAQRTVYVQAAFPCSYGFSDDLVITIDPGERFISKEMPTRRFGRQVAITYDAETGLSLAAVRQEAYPG